VSLRIKEINYDNLDDLKKLESALKNWFANPKELNFTDPNMQYPFDMKKWININYKLNQIQTIVLSEDDWIIGFGGLKFFEKSNRAHIAQVYLDSNQRGKGYRKKMINYIEDLATRNKVGSLTVNAMKKDISARALYESVGYQEVNNKGNVITLEKKPSHK
jgi:GNAT superfamily N-acetyltransferase